MNPIEPGHSEPPDKGSPNRSASSSRTLTLLLRKIYASNLGMDEESLNKALRDAVKEYICEFPGEERAVIVASALNHFKIENKDNADIRTHESDTGADKELQKLFKELTHKENSLKDNDEIKEFCARLKETVEMLTEVFFESLTVFDILQENFGVTSAAKNNGDKSNPIKNIKTPEELKSVLLDWKNMDKGQLKTCLNDAHQATIYHQMAFLKALKRSLQELLNYFSPSDIHKEVRSNGAFANDFGFLLERSCWKKYLKMHEELSGNDEKTLSIIMKEFQRTYLSFLKEKQNNE